MQESSCVAAGFLHKLASLAAGGLLDFALQNLGAWLRHCTCPPQGLGRSARCPRLRLCFEPASRKGVYTAIVVLICINITNLKCIRSG